MYRTTFITLALLPSVTTERINLDLELLCVVILPMYLYGIYGMDAVYN